MIQINKKNKSYRIEGKKEEYKKKVYAEKKLNEEQKIIYINKKKKSYRKKGKKKEVRNEI